MDLFYGWHVFREPRILDDTQLADFLKDHTYYHLASFTEDFMQTFVEIIDVNWLAVNGKALVMQVPH